MLWKKIIEGEIEGYYDDNKKQQYETINFGVLYLNTISRTLKDKFGATIKRKSDGNIVTFDRVELDRLEQVYGDKSDVKIQVKIIKDYEKEFLHPPKQDDNNVGNQDNVGYEGSGECVNDADLSNH
jgi:hypothetical protein